MASATGSVRSGVRRKASAALVAVLLFGGIVGLSSSTPAGAAGVTHRVSTASMVNLSSAVEKPSISFSCNDVTGKYTFKISNVQVIGPDHVTPWASPYEVAWGLISGGFTVYSASLAQNGTNGLYTATKTGVLSNIGDCATGVHVQVADWVTAVQHSELFMVFEGPLS